MSEFSLRVVPNREQLKPAKSPFAGHSFRSGVTRIIYDVAEKIRSKPETESVQEFFDNEMHDFFDNEIENLYFWHFGKLPEMVDARHPDIAQAAKDNDPEKGIVHKISKIVIGSNLDRNLKHYKHATELKENVKQAAKSYLWMLIKERILDRVKEIPGTGETASFMYGQTEQSVDIRRDALEEAIATELQFHGKSPAFAASEANSYAHTLKQMTADIFATLPKPVRDCGRDL